MIDLADRLLGCLLGGACGDAIGAQYEGRPGSTTFAVPSLLRTTDDTQLTRATCEAIVESEAVDPATIARQFAGWFREGRLHGLGASTLKALTELMAGGHWALVGATGEQAAGAGAAMRIAPLAFCLNPERDDDRRTLRDVCRITHRHEEAYIGALAIVRALRHGLAGGDYDHRWLEQLGAELPDSRVRDRLRLLCASECEVADYAARFSASGYVVDAVPMAILAAVRHREFLPGVAAIIRCGGDTDTIAALFGQLRGATHGASWTPDEICQQVDAAPQVRTIAAELIASPAIRGRFLD